MLQWRNRYFLVLDLILIGLAAYLSFVLRLDTFRLDSGNYFAPCLILIVTSELVIPLVFYGLRIYAAYWRFASARELMRLAEVLILGVVIATVVSTLAAQVLGVVPAPQSIPFIFAFLSLPMVTAPRFFARFSS